MQSNRWILSLSRQPPPPVNVLIVHREKVAGRRESYTSGGPWQAPEIQYFVDALGRFTDVTSDWDVLLTSETFCTAEAFC